MTSTVPTRAQCSAAAARLKLQRARRIEPVYLARGLKPLHRQNAHDETCIAVPHLAAGAMLLAAEQSIRDVNAAIWHATVLLALDETEGDRSALVWPLALALVRNGWRRKAPAEVREAAEHNAQVDVELGITVHSN